MSSIISHKNNFIKMGLSLHKIKSYILKLKHHTSRNNHTRFFYFFPFNVYISSWSILQKWELVNTMKTFFSIIFRALIWLLVDMFKCI